MSIFEKNMMPSASFDNQKENSFLYSERIVTRADGDIERIKAIMEGRIKTLNLSPEDFKRLEDFESELNDRAKNVTKSSITAKFYLDYFLTEDGKKDLIEMFGEGEFGNSKEEVKEYFLANREQIKNDELFETIQKRSEDFSRDQILNVLVKNMDSDGNIDVSLVQNPERVQILLNPKTILEKINKLRNLRREFKAEMEELGKSDSDLDMAKWRMMNIYKRRFNEIIAQQFNSSANMKRLVDDIGMENLKKDELELLRLSRGLISLQRNYSRMDKFVYGASSAGFDEKKWRPQIGEEFGGLISELGEKYMENEMNKYELVRRQGLDPEKVFKKNLNAVDFQRFGEEVLDVYGVKSEYPADAYESNGSPALDGGWRFVVKDYFKKAEVSRKEKVIKVDTRPRTIQEIFSVVLGHEVGHMLQSLNSSKLPFKILRGSLKAGRASVFSEGGAMMLEDEISFKIFGVHSYPKVNYANAMISRLNGGSYLDCAKAYYEWERKVIVEQRKRGVIDDGKSRELFEQKLKTALNSTKRLFYGGNSLDSKTGFLLQSKSTNYLEGYFVAKKLRMVGLEKLAFVPGLNLQTLADLLEIGAVDLSKIQEPNLHILNIWNRIKKDYQLNE